MLLHGNIKGSNRNLGIREGNRQELFENYRRKNRVRKDKSNSEVKVEKLGRQSNE